MPNDNDLIERYLYAITRRLPAKQRADVAEELRTLISDMLDERCRGLPPTAKDVRVVLTELGTPGEMVRKYTADEDACLIGQPYYAQYLYVLKIVLACVAGGMIVAGVLTLATGAEGSVLGNVLGGIGSLVVALVFAFAIVTLLFAFFSHRGVARSTTCRPCRARRRTPRAATRWPASCSPSRAPSCSCCSPTC